MKSSSVTLGVMLIGGAIFGYAEAWGVDWRLYSFDDLNIRYYDAEGIKRPSKNIVRVWVKWEYQEKGVIEIVKKFGKKYENINLTIALKEINCSDKTMRDLSLDDYSKEGKIIFSTSSEDKWDYIVQDSAAEVLYKAVCE